MTERYSRLGGPLSQTRNSGIRDCVDFASPGQLQSRALSRMRPARSPEISEPPTSGRPWNGLLGAGHRQDRTAKSSRLAQFQTLSRSPPTKAARTPIRPAKAAPRWEHIARREKRRAEWHVFRRTLGRVPPRRQLGPAKRSRSASAEPAGFAMRPRPAGPPSAKDWPTRAPAASWRCSRRRSAGATLRASPTIAARSHSSSAFARHRGPPASAGCVAERCRSGLAQG